MKNYVIMKNMIYNENQTSQEQSKKDRADYRLLLDHSSKIVYVSPTILEPRYPIVQRSANLWHAEDNHIA